MVSGVITAGELRLGAVVILPGMAAVICGEMVFVILASARLPGLIPRVGPSVMTSAVAIGMLIVIRRIVVVIMTVMHRSATSIAIAVTASVIAASASVVATTASVLATAPSAIHRRSKVRTRGESQANRGCCKKESC